MIHEPVNLQYRDKVVKIGLWAVEWMATSGDFIEDGVWGRKWRERGEEMPFLSHEIYR